MALFRLGNQFLHSVILLRPNIQSHFGLVGNRVKGRAAGLKPCYFAAPGNYRVDMDRINGIDGCRRRINGVDAKMRACAVRRSSVDRCFHDVTGAMVQSRRCLTGFSLLTRPQVDAEQDIHIFQHAGFDHPGCTEQLFLRRLKKYLQSPALDACPG